MKAAVPNINAFWAGLIVEELIRNGVNLFCIAPGSRSSPLSLAVAQNSRARSVVHFDERGLAYFALGHARGIGRAAAVITTSGTAAANLLPAVIESSLDSVPLILLTADRPPELRDTSANQSIDQVKIFGQHVRWFADLPCPSADLPPEMALTTIDHAVRVARGPVHINCMFREPLAPVSDGVNLRPLERRIAQWRRSTKPFTQTVNASRQPPDEFQRVIQKDSKRGIVVVGALMNRAETEAVSRFVARLGWPVMPDILSGLRVADASSNIIAHGDLVLIAPPKTRIDAVLHLGGRIVSRRVSEFINRTNPSIYVVANESPHRFDPAHRVTHRFEFDLTNLPAIRGSADTSRWSRAGTRVERLLNDYEIESRPLTEPLVARLVSRLMPGNHTLFLGNSMPVRDMNMFAVSGRDYVHISANRGASGIDGNIASGLGLGSPATIVVGDLAALHDLNSLALARNRKTVIIVINNNGGGIFSFLPVVSAGAHFERLFGAPHGLGFKGAASLFGLDYQSPATPQEFEAAYLTACDARNSTLIEVRTDRDENVAEHRRLQSAIKRALAG